MPALTVSNTWLKSGLKQLFCNYTISILHKTYDTFKNIGTGCVVCFTKMSKNLLQKSSCENQTF